MPYECLLYEVKDRVATLTLNRPERLNALGGTLRDDLLDAVTKAAADPDVGALVITGAGRGFCSGGDVKSMGERNQSGATPPAVERFAPPRDRIVLALRDCTKPVIAAINGVAAGAGVGLALACDMRIASTTAKFSVSFAKRGLTPDWGVSWMLPRVIGTAKACELIFTGDAIDATQAAALGLVNAVVAPEALMAETCKLARKVADAAPVAIRLSKRAIHHNAEVDLRAGLEFESFTQNLCKETEDHREGVKAFLVKRGPVFSGR